MSNSTTRRRGRHAAAPIPERAPLYRPPARRRSPRGAMHLPGMEVLGFYDEPYSVRVAGRLLARPRSNAVISELRRPTPAPDATSRVASLWETTQLEESALDWWKPQVIARRRLGGRRVRTGSLVLATLVVVAVAAGALFTVRGSSERAEQSLSLLRSDANRLAGAIPLLGEVVSALDNPEAPGLAASTQAVLAAEGAARDLFSHAGSLEEESPARRSAVAGASAVLDVSSRVNRLLAYRLAAQGLLVAPELPASPSVEDLPSVTEIVTGWRVEVEVSLEDLVAGALPDYHARLADWVTGLDAWQSTYLDAVRQEDPDATSAAREDLDGQLTGLFEELLGHLSETGGELLSELADGTASVEELLGD